MSMRAVCWNAALAGSVGLIFPCGKRDSGVTWRQGRRRAAPSDQDAALHRCAAGAIDSHPALKAVSPQAPVTNLWGDDSFHNGAFYLIHNFQFFGGFGRKHDGPVTEMPERPKYLDIPDAYRFFLELGSLKNVNEKYFKDSKNYLQLR